MTYQQTLDYLFSRLPMFQRIGAAAYKANLDNTHKIAELLGQPHKKLKCIHVAGTNGKGSSSHMLAAILQKAGYKTGLYTSPHLVDFRERIKINGKLISKTYITEFVAAHKESFEKIEPSFFEWTVGLAFDYFAHEEVDVAVIEVGLGGRLDSTNIITPLVSLITNISNDHAALLGDTLQKIAGEKAGIIKHKTPVVISQQQSDIYPVFNAKAQEMKAPVSYADKRFKILKHEEKKDALHCEILDKKNNNTCSYQLDLTGTYQLKNILGVLETTDIMKEKGFIIEEKDIQNGLKQVCELTGFMGRWQTFSHSPLIITDTGHNEDGIRLVTENIARYNFKHLHMVFGMVNDKEPEKILSLLPKNATYYFTKASVPRSLDAETLKIAGANHKLKGNAYPDVKSALAAAKKAYKKGDLIFAGGSTFIVADLLSL
jgi:dihydrofolate synthase/folylpolyglutamate synthase